MGGTATAPEREVDVLRRCVALVVDRLPTGWQADVVEVVVVVVGAGGRRADAVMDLTASDGSRAVLGLRRPGLFVHWSTSRRRSVSRSLCADPVRPPVPRIA